MGEEKLNTGINAETGTANVENASETTEPLKTENAERMFTESQVNEIIKTRLNKFYKRYGVDNSKGLDDLIGMAQSYKAMKDLYSDAKIQHSQITEENSGLKRDMMFMRNNIDQNRYDEIIALFKGRDLELNEDNFKKELASHNEWIKPTPNFQTFNIGASQNTSKSSVNEKDEMAKIFGLKKFI